MFLLKLSTETHKDKSLSHLYSTKLSEGKFNITDATWLEVNAFIIIPEAVISKFILLTKSLINLINFFIGMLLIIWP